MDFGGIQRSLKGIRACFLEVVRILHGQNCIIGEEMLELGAILRSYAFVFLCKELRFLELLEHDATPRYSHLSDVDFFDNLFHGDLTVSTDPLLYHLTIPGNIDCVLSS